MPGKPYQGKPYDFNSYAAGNKIYGGGRSFPTMGPVDIMGYRERDLKTKAKRNAMLRRLKAGNTKNFNSPAWLGGKEAS
jgi:hypothetical protein